MLKSKTLLIFVSFIACGCATHYKGGKPNLSLDSPTERKQEFEKFKFQEFHLIATGTQVIPMGDEQVYYRDKQMMEVIQSISPKAYSTFETVDTLSVMSFGFLGAGIGLMVGAFIVNDTPTSNLMYLSSLLSSLASISLSFAGQGYAHSGIRTYNQDLKTKLLQDHIARP